MLSEREVSLVPSALISLHTGYSTRTFVEWTRFNRLSTGMSSLFPIWLGLESTFCSFCHFLNSIQTCSSLLLSQMKGGNGIDRIWFGFALLFFASFLSRVVGRTLPDGSSTITGVISWWISHDVCCKCFSLCFFASAVNVLCVDKTDSADKNLTVGTIMSTRAEVHTCAS